MDGQIPPDNGRAEAGAKAGGRTDGANDEPDGSSRETPEVRLGFDDLVRKARSWIQKAAPTQEPGSLEDRLDALLNDEADEGAPRSRSERMLLANVMRLRDTRVEDVMIPRADIVAIERDASLDETWQAFRSSGHSRLPVYRETLDDPLGVVHLKDIALDHGFGARVNDFSLSGHIRDALVVPPSMRVHALLERMQASRKHMALVVDEYGGVDGLVTIEDLIEQIVGDIEDEHDGSDGPSWIELNGVPIEDPGDHVAFDQACGIS